MKRILTWIDNRFPLSDLWNEYMVGYIAPKNFNFWYFFGVFSLVVLINQILTGIWLTMYFTPTAAEAFNSVEHIMRDVNFGWLIRYMHTTGASAFFLVVYLHMYRSIMYGSFKAPRELIWMLGMFIFLILMFESGTGYMLPWGQMSYWAIKVLISVFSVIPFIGKEVMIWLQGDYNVTGVTLHRFYAFHVIAFPAMIVFLTVLHIMALHRVGSNNPDGITIDKKKEGVPFHPYYTVKDFMGVIVFLFVFAIVIFFAPTMGGYFIEYANNVPANPLVTPMHIAPPWYFAPFYSILRAVPSKIFGVVLTAASLAFLFVMPWLDRSRVRSIRYRGIWTKWALTLFVISFASLGVLGTQPLSDINIICSRVFVTIYFLYFILMPFYTRYEKTKPLPDHLT